MNLRWKVWHFSLWDQIASVYREGVSNLSTGWIIQVLPAVSGDKEPQNTLS